MKSGLQNWEQLGKILLIIWTLDKNITWPGITEKGILKSTIFIYALVTTVILDKLPTIAGCSCSSFSSFFLFPLQCLFLKQWQWQKSHKPKCFSELSFQINITNTDNTTTLFSFDIINITTIITITIFIIIVIIIKYYYCYYYYDYY